MPKGLGSRYVGVFRNLYTGYVIRVARDDQRIAVQPLWHLTPAQWRKACDHGTFVKVSD